MEEDIDAAVEEPLVVIVTIACLFLQTCRKPSQRWKRGGIVKILMVPRVFLRKRGRVVDRT